MSLAPRLDTAGMWQAVSAQPEQLGSALQTARRVFTTPDTGSAERPRAIVAFGVGTGGAACDALAALAAPQLSAPLVVCHGAGAPAIVGPGCLVLVASLGHDSPETVAALHDALGRGAEAVGVGSDGDLARAAEAAGVPWCPTELNGPSARVALGAATLSLWCALSGRGLLPDPTRTGTAAAATLARRRDVFAADRGTAAELARRIGRTIPLVYGSAGIGAVAADWWKSCVNLNAKSPAFAAALPALAYGELAGWGQGGDITRQTMTLVFLRHGGEPPAAPDLFAAVRAATEEVMADVLEVDADGGDDFARLLDLALLGELVSLELAAHEGVDPGPVPAVDEAHARRP